MVILCRLSVFWFKTAKSFAIGCVDSLLKMPFEIIESANMPTTIFAFIRSSIWQLSNPDFSEWPMFKQSS
ncbi:hypothetical protein DLI08_24760 [Vibrio parahaemolyticus]|nr:hypothetical protein [Vibrio parahaemolyticus]EGX6076748.1 hypothetical protein [Vibrio parahaemolyticus]